MNILIGIIASICCVLIVCHLFSEDVDEDKNRYVGIEFALFLIAAAICFK